MKTYGFIFARGGSKGIPHKNIRPLCGKPLIAYAIEAGLESGCVEKMIVSTDSEEIADTARRYGGEVPFIRPAELASDHASEWLAGQHAIRFLQERGDDFQVFLSLPATAPLRTPEDIRRCVSLFQKGDCDMVVTCTEARRSPYFNMLVMDERGDAKLACTADNAAPIRRQDAPAVYDMTTVAYVSSPSHILSSCSLWSGRVKAVTVDKINAIDIDDPMDWDIAELFMSKRMEGSHENA